MTDEPSSLDRALKHSSMGTDDTHILAARTPISRAEAIRHIATLRAHLAHASRPDKIASAAIALAALLRDERHVRAAERTLWDAIAWCERATVPGEHSTLRPLAELFAAAGRPAEAINWFEWAADFGDTHAFDDAFAVFLAMPEPSESSDVRPMLRALPEPERQLVTMTTFWGADLPTAAKRLRLDEPTARRHELSGLVMLAERTESTLTDDERQMIQLKDPKDRARYVLQKRIQEKAEMAVLLSQLQALRHQTAMSVINNIR